MLTKRTYFIPVLLVCIAFPAVAIAATGSDSSLSRIGVSDAVPVEVNPLERPMARFKRTIRVTVKRMEAARRAEARRERRELYASLPGGVSQETLDAIAACESGGDPTAISSDGSYRGKYQFSVSTWESVGGSGDPAAAPEREQDYRAALLYAASGSSPWPICG